MNGDTRAEPVESPATIATDLKMALRRMPGAVALITTRDPESDLPAGLTASAVIPVSMDPPSMLVAVNQAASAHSAIERARRFCINLLTTSQVDLVHLFSDGAMRSRRFESDEWQYDDGIPYLPSCCASIFCHTSTTLIFGTHELFVGQVHNVRRAKPSNGDPLGWIEGSFAQLGPLA